MPDLIYAYLAIGVGVIALTALRALSRRVAARRKPSVTPSLPIADAWCPECWTEPGDEHQLWCPQVPAEVALAYIDARSPRPAPADRGQIAELRAMFAAKSYQREEQR